MKLLLALVLALPGPALQEEVTTRHPDGSPHEVFTVVQGPNGEEVREGPYRRHAANGTIVAEGEYAADAREGRWVLHYENGERSAVGTYRRDVRQGRWTEFHENGEKRGSGKYSKGWRSGKWKFWTEDGEPDPLHTGEYGNVQVHWPDGKTFGRGASLDGRRHGPWEFVWKDGARLFHGDYVRGVRTGFWSFYLPDGTFDLDLLSGEYVGGVRSDDVPPPPPGHGQLETELRSLSDLPRLKPPAGARAWDEVQHLVDSLAGESAEALLETSESLQTNRRVAVPAVVNRLLELDLAQPEDLHTAAHVYGRILSELAFGQALPWAEGTGADAVLANRRVVARWYAIAALTAEADDYWELDLPLSRPPEGVLPDPRVLLRVPFPRGDGAIGADIFPIYERRFVEDERDLARNAAQAALQWLATEQEPDGSWKPEKHGGVANQGFGLTAFALSAFVAAGNTTSVGPHRENVRRAVHWLISSSERGYFFDPTSGGAMYHHAITTGVLCELAALSESTVLRRLASGGLDILLKARNPYGAWRYNFVPDGSNDTSVTAWVLMALKAGQWAGFEVSEEALIGGAAWIEEMTDPTTGRTGYDAYGSLSARTMENKDFPREVGEAMTAAGVFVRTVCGIAPEQPNLTAKQQDLLLRRPPEWVPHMGSDIYYWYWGALAAQVTGGSFATRWRTALEKAVLPAQHQEGELAGSWDAIGPWAYEGGRLYTTAALALALLAPTRYTLPELDD